MIQIKKDILKKFYPKRKQNVHKYDFGHLLVIGGSKLYSGSPALAALAALKSGTDLVTVAAPERAANIIAGFTPDLITYPLEGKYFEKKHLPELLKLAKNKTAFVIGGGTERQAETLKLIRKFIKETDLAGVVDADGIHALSYRRHSRMSLSCKRHWSMSPTKKRNLIITPHLQEFYVLTGIKITDKSLADKIKIVKKEAARFKNVILLKGNQDIISDGKKVAINKTGNPFMTKGGTGDTLAGICGALLAQGQDSFTAACAASYINGKAGDIAAKKFKQSLLATDVIENIYKVFQ